MMTRQEWIDSNPQELVDGTQAIYDAINPEEHEDVPAQIASQPVQDLIDELYQAYVTANS